MAETQKDDAQAKRLGQVEKRLDRIEKILGVGVTPEAVAAERSKRHEGLLAKKAALREKRLKAERAA